MLAFVHDARPTSDCLQSMLQLPDRQDAEAYGEHDPSLSLAEQEIARLRALRSLEILDTAPEPEFDDLVQLAAALCGANSVISFVDEHRQWFKAALGVDHKETPREIAFCDQTIRQRGLMLVEDAALDPRFMHSPLVTEDPGWRFYAGVPVNSPEGEAVGTLCVFDRVPRSLTAEQQTALRILAGQVSVRIELRAQRKALEQALAASEAARCRAEMLEHQFQAFMDSGPFLAYMKDETGRMLYYNDVFARHFSVSRDAMLNKTDPELWPPEIATTYRKHDLEVLASGKLQVTNEQTSDPDGGTSAWRSYKFPCTGPAGRTLLGGMSIEVTEELHRQEELRRYQAELEAANSRLRELASVDALTGLPNRRAFDDQLRRSFRDARRTGSPLCLLLFDVDRFKSHNDRFGHAHGDIVLRTLAEHLGSQLRVGDHLARYGGEEFTLLLPNTDEESATSLAQRLLESVRKQDWPLAPVTVSAGLSQLTPATPDTQRLFTLADEALYAAKCNGRDQMVSYTEIMRKSLQTARGHAQAAARGTVSAEG